MNGGIFVVIQKIREAEELENYIESTKQESEAERESLYMYKKANGFLDDDDSSSVDSTTLMYMLIGACLGIPALIALLSTF